MEFSQKTVLGLFDSSKKHFIIPVYQRAYSWEKLEWKNFIEDLEEQTKGENKYYYGNLLLETIVKDREYEIIDGQQRITTITIFMRALVDVLKERNLDVDIDIDDIEKTYLKNRANMMLR